MDERKSSISITQQNRQMVLEIIRLNPRVSRKEVSSITGMSPSLITKICAELLDKKLIREVGSGHSSGGRRPVYIEMDHSAFYLLSIYLSKKDVKIGVCDYRGNIKAQYKKELTFADILSGELVSILREYENRAGYLCRGVGIAAADPVFFDTRFIRVIEGMKEEKNILAMRSSHAALVDLNKGFYDSHDRNSIYIHFGADTYGAVMSNGIVLDGKNGPIGSEWRKIPYLSMIEADLVQGKVCDEKVVEYILKACDFAHALYSVDMVFVDVFDSVFSENVRKQLEDHLPDIHEYDIEIVRYDTIFQKGVTTELARRINDGV